MYVQISWNFVIEHESLNLIWDELAQVLKYEIIKSTVVHLKAPYSSKVDILLSKTGLINWYK